MIQGTVDFTFEMVARWQKKDHNRKTVNKTTVIKAKNGNRLDFLDVRQKVVNFLLNQVDFP